MGATKFCALQEIRQFDMMPLLFTEGCPMEILLVRHAIAEDRETFHDRTGQGDEQRPLTPEGWSKMRKAVKGLCLTQPRLELIAASPLRRAGETADLISEYYPKARRVELDCLMPGGSRLELLEWLQQQLPQVHLVLVGHEPDLGGLGGWLLSGHEGNFLQFKKGAACLLEFSDAIQPGSAVLRWALTPAQMRHFGTLIT
jgi:phosphohistidine phosphatase